MKQSGTCETCAKFVAQAGATTFFSAALPTIASIRPFFAEYVQKSVAHLNLIIEDQLFIQGVPHLTEHALKKNLSEYYYSTGTKQKTNTMNK